MKVSELVARRNKQGYSQTLAEHSRNVAKLMEEACKEFGLSRLGSLTGYVHDGFKATDKWQEYILNTAEAEDCIKGEKLPHAPPMARWLWNRYGVRYCEKLDNEANKENIKRFQCARLVAQLIVLAVYCHHNTLFDIITPKGEVEFFNRMERNLPDEDERELTAFFEQVISKDELDRLFNEAVLEMFELSKAIISAMAMAVPANHDKKINQETNGFLLGLVERCIFATLIDSDRYDAACFEMGLKPNADSIDSEVWDKLTESFENALVNITASKKSSTAEQIYDGRQQISAACRNFAKKKGGVYRLYAPTGSGKSYAALRFALHHAKQNNKKRIFYIVPYLAVIDQTADDYRKVLGDEAVLEFHSAIEKDGTPLQQLIGERFDKPIVLTTLVQFLNAFFSGNGSSARRLRAFFNSVIILDEVQAMPDHCVYLFNMAVRFISNICGATVVLSTATQPCFESTKHPLCVDKDGEMLPNYKELYGSFLRVSIYDHITAEGYSVDEVAEFALDKAKGDSALIVCNTKAITHSVYENLAKNKAGYAEVYELTTLQCSRHRLNTIAQIKDKLKNNEKLLVVSTSLVEFGVDLSFLTVIRCHAGIPSIAQVAGRCNRHGERELGAVYILNCKEKSVEKMPELEKGQYLSKKLLSELKEAGRETTDLLSPEIIESYYRQYYDERWTSLDELIDKNALTGTSLFDILSDNCKAYCEAYRSMDKEPAIRRLQPVLLRQAFESAGKAFEVISKETVGVIVPYKEEGRAIIATLFSEKDIGQKKEALRRAQGYTVGVYPNMLESLDKAGALAFCKEVGVYVLKEGNYDPKLGVSITAVISNEDAFI